MTAEQITTCTEKINIKESECRALEAELVNARKCVDKLRLEKSSVGKNKVKWESVIHFQTVNFVKRNGFAYKTGFTKKS